MWYQNILIHYNTDLVFLATVYLILVRDKSLPVKPEGYIVKNENFAGTQN